MAEQSVGDLVRRASEELSELVRSELRLARAEMVAKGRRASRGGVLFAGAGVIAFLGLAALVAGGVAGLGIPLPLWAAALVAGGALLLLAGLLALAGKRQASRAVPVQPVLAIDGLRADVEEIRERAVHHDKHPGEAPRAGGERQKQAG